jgi:CRP-like cAMP-binding protein
MARGLHGHGVASNALVKPSRLLTTTAMHGNNSTPIKAFLSQSPLFGDLDQEAQARIACHSTCVRLSNGKLLFEKGSPCDGLYLVAFGQIKLFFTSHQGQEKVAEIVGEGECLGETLMFADQNYPYSGQALCDTMTVHISKAAILDELEANPALRVKLLSHMSLQLHKLINQDQSNAQQSGTERFISYLLRQIQPAPTARGEVEVELPTSKANISSLLNLTREHFSRILRSLSQRGLIAVNGYRILIPDVSLLMDYRDQGSFC